MAGQLEEEPTVIDAYPRELVQEMVRAAAVRTSEMNPTVAVKMSSAAVDGKGSDPPLDRVGEDGGSLAV